MPSTAGPKDERPRPEFVLGDRYGTSCVGAVAETVETTLRTLGYAVSRNKPYAGGFITEHYGNPAAGLHAIQLEINRALYMDERRYERSATFGRLAADLETLAEPPRRDPARGAAALSGGGRIAASAGADKKRAARGCKRPKSREETPKEGSGSSSLPHCNNIHRDAQNARRGSASIPRCLCNRIAAWLRGNSSVTRNDFTAMLSATCGRRRSMHNYPCDEASCARADLRLPSLDKLCRTRLDMRCA